jgi:hypothetical protein
MPPGDARPLERSFECIGSAWRLAPEHTFSAALYANKVMMFG